MPEEFLQAGQQTVQRAAFDKPSVTQLPQREKWATHRWLLWVSPEQFLPALPSLPCFTSPWDLRVTPCCRLKTHQERLCLDHQIVLPSSLSGCPFVWDFLSFHKLFEWCSRKLWFRLVSSLNALVRVHGLFWCPFCGRCFEECSDSWCNDGFQFPYLSSEDLDAMTLECLPSLIFCEPLIWNNRYEHTIKHYQVGSLLLLCFPLHHITN